MTDETLIVVDEEDNVLERESRHLCHEGKGKLHRAITVFVFNPSLEKILLQRRSDKKQLWPGRYDVSCATHVHPEETYKSAAERRLPEELGFASELECLTKFRYQNSYSPKSSENEMCTLLLGMYDDRKLIKPNEEEVKECEWIDFKDLISDVSLHPEEYTPWLKLSVERFHENLDEAQKILKGLFLFSKRIPKEKIGKDLKAEYYCLLTKVGKTVDEVVMRFYREGIYPKFPEKEKLYKKMLGRKIGTQKLRAMTSYLAFRAFGVDNSLEDEKTRRIITAVELENWSNYELNWLFDGKSNTRDLLSVKEAGLATHGFINDALRLVLDMPGIVDTFLELNDRTHRGWTPELYDLSLENTVLLKDFEKFWKAYQTRTVEAGGQFYGNYATLAYKYSRCKNDLLHNQLKQIYQEFGEYIQIINDIGDFAFKPKPKDSGYFVSEKSIIDQFSDLRTDTVTWPIWLMYNRGSQDDKDFMRSIAKRKEFGDGEETRIAQLFYKTGTYNSLCQMLRTKRLRLESKIHCLDIDPLSRGLIKTMITMIPSNRIILTLRNIQNETQLC